MLWAGRVSLPAQYPAEGNNMPAKLGTKPRKAPALVVSREAVNAEKLVYVACANKKIQYPLKKSAIAYIGTTKKGVDRITGSAAKQARDLLEHHGVQKLSFFIVTCRPEKNVESWKLLERALIIRFRELHGCIPKGNDKFKNAPRSKEFGYFTDASLDKVITQYATEMK